MRSLTAFRMVVHDRSSTAGALLGVVAVVFLVGQQLSILFGLLTYMSVLVDHSGADAWVMSANLRHADAGNLVAARYMDRIVGLAEVDRIHGILLSGLVAARLGRARRTGGRVISRYLTEGVMHLDRRGFTQSLTGLVGALVAGSGAATASSTRTAASLARAQARLPPAIITKIRVFYPPNYNPNGPQAFPQSNMVVLVDTDAGITGIGQGGSPDTVRNVARSVIGKNAFDTEMIWQSAYMDGFYSPGKERLHALGAIDMALWDIKGKALNAPLYQLFGGKAREHIELYATSGLPQGVVPPAEAAAMGLKERAAATMAAGYRVFRVDSGIMPSTGRARGGAGGAGAAGDRTAGAPVAGGPARGQGGRGGSVFDSRSRIPLIIQAVEQIREGVGPDGNWMIDLHQKFDFHEAAEVCRLMEPYRPFCVEDPLREEQFRTQLPKLRLLTIVPMAPGEEWGTRADFSPLVEQRDVDFARASLPNVGGITEMLKIMAVCDTHKVGIVPHFTGPIATAGHMHTMMAFPGQVLMEYNQGERAVPYLPEFLDCRNGKVWPNDRPGLGVSVDEQQLTFIEAMTEAAPGPTHRRPDGSLSHW